MIILVIVLVIFAAMLLNWHIEAQAVKIKSDEDLMQRFVVLEHRRYRKSVGKPPLF